MERRRSLAKLGIRGSPTAGWSSRTSKVPVANRLGEEGAGFKIAWRCSTDRGRGSELRPSHRGGVRLRAQLRQRRHQFFSGSRSQLPGNSIHAGRQSATQIEAGAPSRVPRRAKVDSKAADLQDCGHGQLLPLTGMKVTTTASAAWRLRYISDYPSNRLLRDAKITH